MSHEEHEGEEAQNRGSVTLSSCHPITCARVSIIAHNLLIIECGAAFFEESRNTLPRIVTIDNPLKLLSFEE